VFGILQQMMKDTLRTDENASEVVQEPEDPAEQSSCMDMDLETSNTDEVIRTIMIKQAIYRKCSFFPTNNAPLHSLLFLPCICHLFM